jgi:uncharacterized membrane protein
MVGMELLVGLLVVLVAVWIVCTPVALVVSLRATRKLRELEHGIYKVLIPAIEELQEVAPTRAREVPGPTPEVPPERRAEAPVVSEATPPVAARPVPQVPAPADTTGVAPRAPAVHPPYEAAALEQRIGTRWVLIAGVITIVFAVGFFLKYAYDSGWIGPLGRVLVAGAGGLLALAVGEITRRRGYDIVAKGVTALGFAILYATVFAAHRWYGLLGSAPAYVLAVALTAAAMSYAVVLDEIIMALLALAGGYLTPLVLSTGENLPTLLFSYVLILSAGAVLCAYWRRWPAVNVLAFLGTFLLYTGWFERFYRPAMRSGSSEQFGVALFWLAVFFRVYLAVPLVHTLVRRVRSRVQDLVLVLADGGIVLYYLATMLARQYEHWLALGSLLMGVAYLGLAGLAWLRCRDDANLRSALFVAAVAFASLAVPLYFETNAIAAVWAIEAVAFAALGLRYRSTIIQSAATAMLALAVGSLVYHLPMHTTGFRLFFNPTFGTWCLVAAAVLACHVLCRLDVHLDAEVRQIAIQVLYAAGLLVLMAALGMELWHHGLNIKGGDADMHFFAPQMTLVFAFFLLLFVAKPLAPRGLLCLTLAAATGAVGSVFLLVAYPEFHRAAFTTFANFDFVRALLLVVALFLSVWLLRRGALRQEEEPAVAAFLALAGILVLWLLLTEEIWLHYRLRERPNWQLPAHMYISVMWAVYASVLMVLGFWQRIRPLRYIALGIFVLLLAKIFVIDTSRLETAYRIAGFLATGLALVGVSYLYQYLKKMGFFEAVR